MIAEVIVDISNSEVDRVFDYIADFSIEIGMRVLVPFGHKKIEGFVIAIKEKTKFEGALKPIYKVLDDFVAIQKDLINLMWFMRDKYNLRLVDILHLFVPSKLRGNRIGELRRLYAEINLNLRLEEMINSMRTNATKQISLLNYLSENGGEFVSNLSFNYGSSTINALKEKGFINIKEKQIARIPFKDIVVKDKIVSLNEEQQNAKEQILGSLHNKFLLHGVTGSGKTEVYMSIIKDVVSQGKSAILLVPEISLTPQMLKSLRARFGDTVAILHSALGDGERFDEWRRIHSGNAQIVVGARSAIFAPLKNIGVIIMDEEHEQSYISESNPRYDTHSIAIYRAEYNDAKLILGSATPSIDSYLRAKENEFQLLELTKRVNNIKMPEIEIVDMSYELRMGNRGVFSGELAHSLIDCIKSGNQAMIYINRRGYSSFVMCKKCGSVLKCTDCDVSLTYHSYDNQLKCHYCGKRYKMITNCPECGDDNIRLGRVGTQQVVEEIQKLVPEVKILRMDNDTTRTKTAYFDILDNFSKYKAQILVGTQMIAKGHDFPNVTLVGILDADMSLYFSDYMSAEKTFQLITQVSGRAGRAESGGRVILQTYSPKHYIFNFARNYDYKGFYEKEANIRKVTKFPPFTKIIRVLISGQNEDDVINLTKANYIPLKKLSKELSNDFVYIQAMKSPIIRLENKFRYQILMRINRNREKEIIKEIYEITNAIQSKKVSLFVEINPQNLN